MEISYHHSFGHLGWSDLRDKGTAENGAMMSVNLQLALHRASFFGKVNIM